MRNLRGWAVVPLLMGGLLAGCGGSASPTSAVVTGVAAPCIGVTTTAQYARVPVEVVVKEGSRTVASKTVTGSHTYRFVLPPGRYMVYSNQVQSRSLLEPERFAQALPAVLHSGERNSQNLWMGI